MKEPQLFFDIMLHFGTLFAVVVYFRMDLWKMVKGIKAVLKGSEKNREGVNLFLWIILATLPTGFMGLFLKDWFESLFNRPERVGWMLLVTGGFLWLTRWVKREGRPLEKMRWTDAVLIGIAQGIAITPGISRSGATISTGLFCGLDRELAGRFSFLLSIPAILGAALLEIRKLDSGDKLWMVLIGTAVAFGVGLLALTFLLRIVKMGKICNFSYYCCVIGAVMVIFF